MAVSNTSERFDTRVSFDFAGRRREVMAAMGEGAMLLRAALPTIRNNDVEYEYRQDSDFYYLVGFTEPGSVLLLRNVAGEQKTTLFLRERDPEREVWDGSRLGVERACDLLGVDEALPIASLFDELPKCLEGVERLFSRWGQDAELDRKLHEIIVQLRTKARRGGTYPHTLVDSAQVLHELRSVKDEDELELMRQAAAITCEGHLAAMRVALPGAFEYEVEAELLHRFRRRGSAKEAYPSIVASGSNATVLHYRDKGRQLQAGELLLIDAGCESGLYASDVTRTFPVSGRFSEAQRSAYEVVLSAQKAAIEAVEPGTTLEAIHQVALRTITEGLIRLGVLEGKVETLLETAAYKPFFMHRTSHWIGMDVHDVGPYFRGSEPVVLQPGMVLTVEPGLYFGESSAAPEAFRGIGIRIEDDLVVTSSGRENLNASIPKDVDAIEALLGER